MMVKLGGTQVAGGEASQGYIRWADAIRDASIHWAGLVTTTSANQILTIELGKDAAAGTVTVGGEKGNLVHREDCQCKFSFCRLPLLDS